jgi:hypothetical protein
MDVFHILTSRHTGFEDEIIEQADQSPQDSQDNHANEIRCKGHDLLEPDNKRYTSGAGGDSRLPEFAKAWKTGNKLWLIGHGNLRFEKSDVVL